MKICDQHRLAFAVLIGVHRWFKQGAFDLQETMLGRMPQPGRDVSAAAIRVIPYR